MVYDKLEGIAYNEGLQIIQANIPTNKIKGLICDNNIILDNSIKTEREANCVIAEELGHYFTSSGNILNQRITSNRKQEKIAHVWAVENLISWQQIIAGKKQGLRNVAELAEFLNVTEDFLIEAIEIWKQKYGLYYVYENYVITFDPLDISEARDKVKKKYC